MIGERPGYVSTKTSRYPLGGPEVHVAAPVAGAPCSTSPWNFSGGGATAFASSRHLVWPRWSARPFGYARARHVIPTRSPPSMALAQGPPLRDRRSRFWRPTCRRPVRSRTGAKISLPKSRRPSSRPAMVHGLADEGARIASALPAVPLARPRRWGWQRRPVRGTGRRPGIAQGFASLARRSGWARSVIDAARQLGRARLGRRNAAVWLHTGERPKEIGPRGSRTARRGAGGVSREARWPGGRIGGRPPDRGGRAAARTDGG